jgi:RluA family pseudouridine synthase
VNVVYQDDHLLVIDKPAGVVAHPTYKQTSGTVLNGLLWHLRDRGAITPGILTRLDKDTSGLMIVALSPGVHAAMQRDAAAGRLRKEYLAAVTVTPDPPSGTITLALARDPHDRRRVVPSPEGAPSETRYEVLSTSMHGALVRCELVTGRTHQIRVHLAHLKHPVLGDDKYGDFELNKSLRKVGLKRMFLHAARLGLDHPVTHERIQLESPLPADLKRFWEKA